jgi:hypothetical protein
MRPGLRTMARATVIGTVLSVLQGCGTLGRNTIFLYYVRPSDAVVVTQRNQVAQLGLRCCAALSGWIPAPASKR